jgi:hypothetical protein
MYPEVAKFNQWLRCQFPQSTTAVHYGQSKLCLDVQRFWSGPTNHHQITRIHLRQILVSKC